MLSNWDVISLIVFCWDNTRKSSSSLFIPHFFLVNGGKTTKLIGSFVQILFYHEDLKNFLRFQFMHIVWSHNKRLQVERSRLYTQKCILILNFQFIVPDMFPLWQFYVRYTENLFLVDIRWMLPDSGSIWKLNSKFIVADIDIKYKSR